MVHLGLAEVPSSKSASSQASKATLGGRYDSPRGSYILYIPHINSIYFREPRRELACLDEPFHYQGLAGLPCAKDLLAPHFGQGPACPTPVPRTCSCQLTAKVLLALPRCQGPAGANPLHNSPTRVPIVQVCVLPASKQVLGGRYDSS